jgi:hypothetical protein
MFADFSLKKLLRVSLSIGVTITTILCVLYLLRIFKMFHGLMNNPIYTQPLFYALLRTRKTRRKSKVFSVTEHSQP